jgi:L-lactate dehydrogenase (cytochrome)
MQVEERMRLSDCLSLGAKAVGLGRFYLYPLAAAGQVGVERALELMKEEIVRGVKLMGCKSTRELSPENVRLRRASGSHQPPC